MKMLLGFGDWLSESEKKELTPEQEEFLNKCTQGRWEFDSQTGEVGVVGDFFCSDMQLKDLKGIRFGRVSGDFLCYGNSLESLTGSPRVVGGSFFCNKNSLKTLAGGPLKIGGSFYCNKNSLESLAGGPQQVGGAFYCYNNLLETLTGAPEEVGGGFYCGNNRHTTLEGSPRKVGGSFSCRHTNLKSLAGAPQKLDGDFDCYAFYLEWGEWNLEGWMKILEEGDLEAQNLILTILTPEVLNQEIQNDPQGMLQILKGVWDAESFAEVQKKLKFPDGYDDVGQTIRSLQKLDSMKDFI